MKKDYLSRLNVNQILTNLTAVLAVVCLSAFSLQAQSDATVSVTAPAGSETDIPAIQAAFGPGVTMDISGPVVEGIDTSGASTGCGSVTADLTGAIALIDRGTCAFFEKAINAQNAGAIALIVCNSAVSGGVPQPYKGLLMGAGANDPALVTIPVVAIPYQLCAEMRVDIGNGLEVTISNSVLPVAAGESCDEAIEIGPGTYTVPELTSGYGAVLANASNAKWYSYTPAANTLATVSSCGLADADTRLYILTGTDCTLADAVIYASNDDCDPDNANFASEVSFLAAAGTRYWIYWDDRWDYSGFDFELTEGALPDVDVNFIVNMANEAVSGDGVSMVYAPPGATGLGDVTIVPLADGDGDGVWDGSVTLTAFDTIGYAFANGNILAGGELESVPGECGVDGGFGFNVRPFIVLSPDPITIDTVCFSTCLGFCPSTVISCTDPDVIFCDEFENGTGNWVLQAPWGLTTTQSFSPSNSLTDSPAGNYAANRNITATMATGLDLSTYLDAKLAFRAIYDIEGGNFDYCFVEASTNGGTTWVEVARFLGEDNLTPWVQYIFSLGGFVGNSDVRIRFRFFSDGGYEVDGIYIDDVIVTASTEDNAAPLILHTPSALYESQLGDITQTAEIVDISGLASAELSYSVDGVPTGTVAGTDIGGNQWEFVIPEQEAGAQVDYYVHAVDASANSNEATSPTFSYIAGNHIFYDNGVTSFVNDIGPTAATELAAAVRITIDGTTQIAYALIRNYTDTNRPNDSIDVHIWAPDANGRPGADLIDPIRVQPEANLVETSPMTRVDLRPYASELTGLFGDVFVGFTVPTGQAWITQTTPAIANRTFDLIGANWTAATDDYHFRLVTSAITPADNDCIGATDINNLFGQGVDVPVTSGLFNNNNYTSTDQDPDFGYECFAEPGTGAPIMSTLERTIWTTFVGDGNEYYITTVECNATDYIDGGDTQIAVYSGDNCGNLTPVVCGEDIDLPNGIYEAEVTLQTEEGVTYYMMIDGFGPEFEADGEFCIQVTQKTLVAVTVTFNVDMSLVALFGTVSPEGVHIAGSFQGWDPAATLMTDNGDGSWSYTTSLPPGTEVQYKYINGNAWGADETNITADCGVDGGSGSFNRVLMVGNEDIATPFYCFDFCVTCDLVSTDEEALQAGVKVFPNPAKELLNVKVDLPEAAENLSIRMINALGQVVSQRYLGAMQNGNVEIDVRNIPAGAYMIQVMDGKAQFTQSVIVE